MAVNRNILEYHKNIGKQIKLLKDQMRNLIGGQHWPTDGAHKESILRKILREHIGQQFHIGTGFLYGNEENSSQIDILITDESSPVLFQDGDFRIVTPTHTNAIIEVKTKQNRTELVDTLIKLSRNIEMMSSDEYGRGIGGVFVYESVRNIREKFCEIFLRPELFNNPVSWVCLGDQYFIRYFDSGELYQRKNSNGQMITSPPQYRLYYLEDLAFSYFLSNVISSCTDIGAYGEDKAWFPLESGKEAYFICGISSNGKTVDSNGLETQ